MNSKILRPPLQKPTLTSPAQLGLCTRGPHNWLNAHRAAQHNAHSTLVK